MRLVVFDTGGFVAEEAGVVVNLVSGIVVADPHFADPRTVGSGIGLRQLTGHPHVHSVAPVGHIQAGGRLGSG
ncbi:hypothetical protein D3C81_2050020 [compost metagenome]